MADDPTDPQLVAQDVAEQLADRHAPAFNGLQKNSAAITKNAGDAAGRAWPRQ